MHHGPDHCSYCGGAIPEGGAVYSDARAKFCCDACARAQLSRDHGPVAERAGMDVAGDRVGPDHGPARSRPGPTER